MELKVLHKGSRKTHSDIDQPLVLEELETPRDRASLLNGAVHYLAGSGSARYPLTYSCPRNDETFFNCLEGDNTRTNRVEYDRESDCDSSYCCGNSVDDDDDDTDSDVEYVKEICRNGIPTKVEHRIDSEGFRTPSKASESRVSGTATPASVCHKVPSMTPSGDLPWRGAFPTSRHASQRPQGIHTREDDVESYYNGYTDDVMKMALTIVRESNNHYHPADANSTYGGGSDTYTSKGVSGYPYTQTDTCGAKNSSTVSRPNKVQSDKDNSGTDNVTTNSKEMVMGGDGTTTVGNGLLSFAKDFKAKYGGMNCQESRLNVEPNYNNYESCWLKAPPLPPPTDTPDMHKPVSWESTTAAGSTLCMYENLHNTKAVGGLSFCHKPPGGDMQCFDRNATQTSKISEKEVEMEEGNMKFKTKESSSSSANIGGKLQLSGFTQSSDILLREYRSSKVDDFLPVDRCGAQSVHDERHTAKDSYASYVLNECVDTTRTDKVSQNIRTKTSCPSNYEVTSYMSNVAGGGAHEKEVMNTMSTRHVTNGKGDPSSLGRKDGVTALSHRGGHGSVAPTSGATVTLAELNQQIDEFFNSRILHNGACSTAVDPPIKGKVHDIRNLQEISSHLNVPGTKSQKKPLSATTVDTCGEKANSSLWPSTSTSTLEFDMKHDIVTTKEGLHHVHGSGGDIPPQIAISSVSPLGMSKQNLLAHTDNRQIEVNAPEKEPEWLFETLQPTPDANFTDLRIPLIHGILNDNNEECCSIHPIDIEKSGDINLYDSTCLEYRDLPLGDDIVISGSAPCDISEQRNRNKTPQLVEEEGTAYDATPEVDDLDDNMPTRTNHLEPDCQIEFPLQPAMITFGDDVAGYIPGARIGKSIDTLCEDDLFDGKRLPLKNEIIVRTTRNFNRFPTFKDMALDTSSSDEQVDFSDGLGTKCVDNAPRNLGYRQGSTTDSQEDIFKTHELLNTSQDTFGEPEQRDSRHLHCQNCRDVIVFAKPVIDDRYPFKVQPVSAMERLRSRRTSKGRMITKRPVYDSSMALPPPSSSQTVALKDRVLLPTSGLRSYSRMDMIDNRMRGSFDSFSEASSDYVHIPSDEKSCANGDGDVQSDFSSSEDFKGPSNKAGLTTADVKRDSSLLNPIEDMLNKHLEKGDSFKDFVALVERLYATLGKKNLTDSNRASEDIKERLDACKSITKSPWTASIKPKQYLDNSSKTDDGKISAKSLSHEKNSLGVSVTTATQTHEETSGRWLPRGVKATKSVSFCMDSSDTEEVTQPKIYNTGKVRNPDDTVIPQGKTFTWNPVEKVVRDCNKGDVARPLTKEALISRMMSEPSNGTAAIAGYKAAETSSGTDFTKAAGRMENYSAKLPNGLTQEQLLDVYNEVMKLTRIFHVKDVKSLARAVTARIQNRTI